MGLRCARSTRASSPSRTIRPSALRRGMSRTASRLVSSPSTSIRNSLPAPRMRPAATLASVLSTAAEIAAAVRPSALARTSSTRTRISSSAAPKSSVFFVPGTRRTSSERDSAKRRRMPRLIGASLFQARPRIIVLASTASSSSSGVKAPCREEHGPRPRACRAPWTRLGQRVGDVVAKFDLDRGEATARAGLQLLDLAELLELPLELLGDEGFDTFGRCTREARRDRAEAIGQLGVLATRQQL